MRSLFFVVLTVIGYSSVFSTSLHAADRHAGYYYPEPVYREIYKARAKQIATSNRKTRIAFVTSITQQSMQREFSPTAAIFAKGNDAEKLIIVGLEDGRLDTIYRARAIFANMTAGARTLPVFQELGVEDVFTFFDLAALMGFTQITITNGRNFTHQVILQ
ncbi:molybdopterin-guanine dinucleotide biosynthesis protein A [Kiloniella spongiae]|uniref:Molybdopterin-guanine dinucleotide biosynthesis protein A n=1 Tax=Kiloniella spongiae TaxID=1489064 RepID=A0A0H2MEZ6_9PROT|nr:molybdopterin-guanine dinucleotide biosynthesis protein A [Kiloniella spongiae]